MSSIETDEHGNAIEPSRLTKFIGLLYDEGGNIWVESCAAVNEEEAYEELERNDSNLMLFTVEEAKTVRDKLDKKIKELEG